MKILLAYDGSLGSQHAVDDLRIAGLPLSGVEVRVLTAAEFVFPATSTYFGEPGIAPSAFAPERMLEMSTFALESAESTAREGKARIEALFPEWRVSAIGRMSSPASTILEVAGDWKPDLIVMGSHGRSALGRFFIGSVSMRVATEAHCAVRIVKQPPTESALIEPVIVVAFDGSAGSRAVIHSLMHRSWPAATRLHIVTVADTSLLASLDYVSLVGSDLYEVQKEGETRLEHLMHSIELEMKHHFRHVTTSLCIGSTAHEILREAETLHASMIFLGSHGYAKLERLLLGSVSHGVSAHAKATVEIVR